MSTKIRSTEDLMRQVQSTSYPHLRARIKEFKHRAEDLQKQVARLEKHPSGNISRLQPNLVNLFLIKGWMLDECERFVEGIANGLGFLVTGGKIVQFRIDVGTKGGNVVLGVLKRDVWGTAMDAVDLTITVVVRLAKLDPTLAKVATQLLEFCKNVKEAVAQCWAFVTWVTALLSGGTFAVAMTAKKLLVKLYEELWRGVRKYLHEWKETVSLENDKAMQLMRNMARQAERLRRLLRQCRRELSQLAWLRT